MKKYSVDETLGKMKSLPEPVSYEEIAAYAVGIPVAAGATVGLFKMILNWLHFKYFIPMFFTSSTAGLVVWYAVQSAAPVSTPPKNPKQNIQPLMVDMKKDLPMSGSTLFSDTIKKKKKIVRKEEVRRYEKGDAVAPLPELPPLPPIAPNEPNAPNAPTRTRTETRKEIREVKEGSAEEKEMKAEGGCGEDDAFIKAMLDYLEKDGLLKDRKKFTLHFKPKQLTVDGNSASGSQLNYVLDLFRKMEDQTFGRGSEISILKTPKTCSLSKSTGDD